MEADKFIVINNKILLNQENYEMGQKLFEEWSNDFKEFMFTKK